jgi:hypothetical protein
MSPLSAPPYWKNRNSDASTANSNGTPRRAIRPAGLEHPKEPLSSLGRPGPSAAPPQLWPDSRADPAPMTEASSRARRVRRKGGPLLICEKPEAWAPPTYSMAKCASLGSPGRRPRDSYCPHLSRIARSCSRPRRAWPCAFCRRREIPRALVYPIIHFTSSHRAVPSPPGLISERIRGCPPTGERDDGDLLASARGDA